MHWYLDFWQHNTTAAVFIHAIVILCIAGAIDGLTFERRYFNMRTRDNEWWKGE